MKLFGKALLLFIFIALIVFIIDWGFGLYINKKHQSFIHLKNYIVKEEIQPLYLPQAYLNYINFPNNDLFQINNAGLRSKVEYEIPKPKNTLRILFLGGSTTFGEVEKVEDGFPAIVEKLLSEKIADKKIECLNAGMGAATSAEIFTHYVFKYQYFNPDIVVIHCGINDAFTYADFENYTYQPDYSTSKKPMKEVFQPSKFLQIVSNSNIGAYFVINLFYYDFLESSFEKNEFFNYHKKNVWLKGDIDYIKQLEHNGFYRNLNNLITLLKKNNKEVLLMDEQVYYDKMPEGIKRIIEGGVEKNNLILEKIAIENELNLIKFSEQDIDDSYFIDNDGIHVNEKGENLKGNLIIKQVLKIIEKI